MSKAIATIEVSPFQRSMFDCVTSTRRAVDKAHINMATRMQELIKSKYNAVMPTWEQFRADRAALAAMAKDKGLVDDQWIRKPYNTAIHALYGALPESQSIAAIAKRKQAAMRSPIILATVASPGAVEGVVGARNASAAEQIEQMVAKFGVWDVLKACTKILATDTDTKEAAAALGVVCKKAA